MRKPAVMNAEASSDEEVCKRLSQASILSGDDSKEVTPVPMPNTEVKLFSADGSWAYVPRE